MARIAIVGSGFAGYGCARHLERALRPAEAEIVLITPMDYSLYTPLLPQVAAGVVQPRSIVAPLHRKLHRTKLLPGAARSVDLDAREVEVTKLCGDHVKVPFDVLVLCPGSMTRTFDIPGLAEHAHGLKTLSEAVYLRDRVMLQLELAASTDDKQERASRCSFLVVGGGYTGSETAACLQLLTSKAMRRFPELRGLLRWTLVDVAAKLLPELGDHLGEATERILRKRGVDVRLGVTVDKISADSAELTDGTTLPTSTVIWAAGVTPRPVVSSLGTETAKSRLVVGTDLQVAGHPGVFALGDAAAVPDLTREQGAVCGATAQHATRQAETAARNAVATLRGTALSEYRHQDLGFVVDLGGLQATADPLGVKLSGPIAQLVTRGYHLLSAPSGRAKARVSGDWLINALTGDDLIRLDFLQDSSGTLAELERT
ncbi:NAD(P)/FAD-dependent oxidoreductase [Nonomuraea sp. NPDC050536]|uniref:NAD(P)/FAD-dependent oxidoreductase n=1 Tax=Nonomuraea sp. NPDC050536 TaxID=3364366 RepID=UPI0037C8E77D